MTKTSEELSEAFGYLYIDEVAALKELAEGLPVNPIAVNIGAGVGTSALAFLEAREDLFLYTIDIIAGIQPTGGLGNEKFALDRAEIDPKRYHQIHGDSITIGKDWPHEPPDLVFVDGQHEYDYLTLEGRIWHNHLNPGGIIVFHDYGHEFWGSLVAAIDNLKLGDPILQVCTLIAFRKDDQ